MTGATRAALEDAVRAHMARSHPGHTVTAWALVTVTMPGDNPDTDTTVISMPEGQRTFVTEGVLSQGLWIWQNGNTTMEDDG